MTHLALYQPFDLILHGFYGGLAEMDGYHISGGANPLAEHCRLGMGVALRPRRTGFGYSGLHGIDSLLKFDFSALLRYLYSQPSFHE